MFEFAEQTKEMTAREILNYYRNLYYAEPQVTERGIVANAINELFKEYANDCRKSACIEQAKQDLEAVKNGREW